MSEDPTVELEELELLDPDQLLIVWGDGKECLLSYFQLRLHCSCARCVDEWSGKPLLDSAKIPVDITVKQWSRTGRYGIGLVFSDGHSTGIYTLRRLRELCEAEV